MFIVDVNITNEWLAATRGTAAATIVAAATGATATKSAATTGAAVSLILRLKGIAYSVRTFTV